MFAKPTRLLLLLPLLCFCHAQAQTYLNDSLSHNISGNIVTNYTYSRDMNLLLYNGIEYARSYPGTTGYPFFITDTFQRSSLLYDGVLYQNVPLAYDAVSQRVVIKNRDSFLIELVPEKVNSFLFKNHVFVSLTPSLIKSDAMPPGLYEMYDYKVVTVFIHHQKEVQRAINAADLDHFADFDAYFIKKGENYFSIKSSNDLLSVFGDRSNEMKSFLHQNKISFKKHPEEAVVKAASYYAQLKK